MGSVLGLQTNTLFPVSRPWARLVAVVAVLTRCSLGQAGVDLATNCWAGFVLDQNLFLDKEYGSLVRY